MYSPRRHIRSSSGSRTRHIPHIKNNTFAHHSSAPSVWNSLPREIRHLQSSTSFKTALTTHLFRQTINRYIRRRKIAMRNGQHGRAIISTKGGGGYNQIQGDVNRVILVLCLTMEVCFDCFCCHFGLCLFCCL